MVSRAYREHKAPTEGADFRIDSYLVMTTVESLTPTAQTWIEQNTEPWQWQNDRLCVELAVGLDILSRIALDGLTYEETPIEIPDERGSAERLLKERNWLRVMQQTMPEGAPRHDDAVAVIEHALRHVGFPIQ